MRKDGKDEILFGIKASVLQNARILKYGVVGCAGIATNLGMMALLLTLGFPRGWTSSAVASVISTVTNFFLHNHWTFSDRRHRGSRLVGGFLSFALISAISVAITTAFYVGFTRIATRLSIVNSHPKWLAIPLTCQFAAVLMGASASYLLNLKLTWSPVQSRQVQEQEL